MHPVGHVDAEPSRLAAVPGLSEVDPACLVVEDLRRDPYRFPIDLGRLRGPC